MKTKGVILLSLFISLSLIIQAQGGGNLSVKSGESYFSVFGHLSKPNGDFADNSTETDGYAKFGYGGGIEYSRLVLPDNIYWVTSAAFVMNPVDSDDIADFVFEDNDLADHLEIKPYQNIPITTGLKYQTRVETFDLYGMAQIGLNIVRMGDWEMTDVYQNGYPVDLIRYEFETTNTLAFILGVGVILKDRFNISARYYALGETEIEEAKVYVDGDKLDWSDAENDHEISMFVFSIGINF